MFRGSLGCINLMNMILTKRSIWSSNIAEGEFLFATIIVDAYKRTEINENRYGFKMIYAIRVIIMDGLTVPPFENKFI